ncbi:MAG: hypothetical protein V4683_15575 [Bacteroidota bacterium]
MKKTTIFLAFIASAIITVSCEKQNAVPQTKKHSNARLNAAAGVEVVPLDGSANGHTYKSLLKETWRWTLAQPMSKDPFAATDGSFHANNQPLGDVMILPSNSGGETERSISIPANMPIFFPVLGGLAWEFINDGNCKGNKISNENAIQHVISKFGLRFNNGAKNLMATIDGVPLVDDFSKYRVQTDPFVDYLHTDYNQYNSNGCIPLSQEAHGQADFYALLVKLPVGQHTIHLAGDMTSVKFHSGITWHVNVL